jgi:hypothetical protein
LVNKLRPAPGWKKIEEMKEEYEMMRKRSYLKRDDQEVIYRMRAQDSDRKLGRQKDQMPGLGRASVPSDMEYLLLVWKRNIVSRSW